MRENQPYIEKIKKAKISELEEKNLHLKGL